MRYHSFDHAGYVYVGSFDADEDPQNPGEYLLPAFATWTPPPPLKGEECARFVQGAWVVDAPPPAAPVPFVVPQVPQHAGAHVEAAPVDRVRFARGQLLSQSDWAVTRAVERGEPVPAAWAAYRQALRDVTLQEGFPDAVVWPVMPE